MNVELLTDRNSLVQMNIKCDEESFKSTQSHRCVRIDRIETVLPEGFDEIPNINQMNWKQM